MVKSLFSKETGGRRGRREEREDRCVAGLNRGGLQSLLLGRLRQEI